MSLSTFHVVVNSDAWSKYSPELQEVLTECAKEAALYAREELNKQEASLRGEFEADGMQFTDLTDDQLAAFKALAKPVLDENLSNMKDSTLEVFGMK